jgi:acetolactate synthase I/III small subunit
MNPRWGFFFIQEQEMEQVIQVWMENKPGALMRVVGILTAKGLNIDSLVVGPEGEDRNVSKMTIVAEIEPRFRIRLVQEINRLVNVIFVKDATDELKPLSATIANQFR